MLALVPLLALPESPLLLLWKLVEFLQDVTPVRSTFTFSSVRLLLFLIQPYNVICVKTKGTKCFASCLLKSKDI